MLLNFTFVTSYGRSGSTVLMRMLCQHPRVLVRSVFPFETRTAQSLYAASKVGDGNPYRGVQYPLTQGGDNVLQHRIQSSPKDRDAESLAREAYVRIADLEQKPNASLAVEKTIGIGLLQDIMADWAGVRAIVLLRDPRSIYMSVKAFNAKRGIGGFGADEGDEQLYARIINFSRSAANFYSAHNSRALLIRYEDFALKPEAVLNNILHFHSIPSRAEDISRMAAMLENRDNQSEAHSTTSLGDSIDGWKSTATTRDMAIFARHSGTAAELGY